MLYKPQTASVPSPVARDNTSVDTAPLTVEQIHQQVLDSFTARKMLLPQLHERALVLEERIQESMSVSDIKSIDIELSHVLAEIKDATEAHSEQCYVKDAERLLSRYHMLITAGHKERAERLHNDYMCLASQHIVIKTRREKRGTSQNCAYCGTDISMSPADTAGVKSCRNPQCGFDNDTTKTLSISPKEYDVWGNFLKAYRRFTGATKLDNVAIVMQDLDRYFAAEGKPLGEYYRGQPLDEVGRKKGTSHSAVLKAFEQLGYEAYYKNYMYVCHRYYGWDLPCTDHLLPAMESNFKSKQEVWKRIAGKGRQGKSSLPTELRLCMELNHAGYKCDLSWFNVTDRPETLEKHLTTYLIMYQGAGFDLPHP